MEIFFTSCHNTCFNLNDNCKQCKKSFGRNPVTSLRVPSGRSNLTNKQIASLEDSFAMTSRKRIMIEITKKVTERAMLVALDTKVYSKEVVEEHLAELEELANTAGAETVFKIIQSKSRMDSAYYIGKGKAEELAQLVELNDINIIIFDDDLSPVQVRNLSDLFKRKVKFF